MCCDLHACLELAATQDFDPVFFLDEAILNEEGRRDFGQGLALDQLLERVEVDALVGHTVRVLETELGHTALKRHLTALEADL